MSSICYLMIIALALTQALPSEDSVPEESSFVEESPNMDLLDVQFQQSKKRVEALLQSGADDTQCRELAQVAKDDVKASVDAEQKSVNGMLNGGTHCDNHKIARDLISAAQATVDAGQSARAGAMERHGAAQNKAINFGSFKFYELTEDECGNFFAKTVWTTAKAEFEAATKHLRWAEAELKAREQSLVDTKKEAAILILKCRCDAKTAIENAVQTYNAKAEDANTKAWTMATHMVCVLDGKTTEKNCLVSPIPFVKMPKLADNVLQACANHKKAITLFPNGRLAPNGAPRVQCIGKSNVIYLYSGPNCTGKKWTITQDTDFCRKTDLNDNVDSVQGCGNVKILHHCNKHSNAIWKNNGSFDNCQNLSANAKKLGPSYAKFY